MRQVNRADPGRRERAQRMRKLRERGFTWEQVASVWEADFPDISPLVAFRWAHNLTHQEVAEKWNSLDPGEPTMSKSRVYEFEVWPKKGRRPSVNTLGTLAFIYQTTPRRLLTDEQFARYAEGDRLVIAGGDFRDRDENFHACDVRPGGDPEASAASEVVGAYAHRSEISQSLWSRLLLDAHESVELLGYAYPFIFELDSRLPEVLAARCRSGAKVRIALADPTCPHVAERDRLEELDGTLSGRIRNALNQLTPLRKISGVEVGLHSVHLYNAIYRFDDHMIVTPYLYRTRGYQHPAIHLLRRSSVHMFARFAHQFEQIWSTVRVVEADET